jgi:uncharacterized protein (DUF2267 family)
MEAKMTATGLAVFDTTLHETNHWLHAMEKHLHQENRQTAYLGLRATLHALRDRLPPESAVHLSAQLPMLLRGLYFEGWKMASTPTKDRQTEDFVEHVRAYLPDNMNIDPHLAMKASLAVLAEHIDPGEVAKIARQLPLPLKPLLSVPAGG